jgi:hypothetical protein
MTDQATQPEKLTHFRKLFNPLYLGAHDLEFGKEYKVAIEKIDQNVEVIGEGGKKQAKAIIHFKGSAKPMILNSVNSKMIAKVLGEKFIEKWIGGSVIIKVVIEKNFGEDMEVIRVMNKKV